MKAPNPATVTGTAGAASLGFGLLVLACVFLAMAAPREGLALRTHALRHDVAAASALGDSVTANIDYAGFDAYVGTPGRQAVGAVGTELAANLTREGLPLAGSAERWYGLSSAFVTVTGVSHATDSILPPQMEVLYRDKLPSFTRLVAGRFPSGARLAGNGAVFQVAVTSATAARFGLRPGTRIGAGTGITLLVTGVVRPVATRSVFWTADPVAAAPALTARAGGGEPEPYWTGAAFVGPGELPLLPQRFDTAGMTVSWSFPLDLDSVTANSAQGIRAGLARAATQAGRIGGARSGYIPVTLSSGLGTVLAVFDEQDAAAAAVLRLLAVGLAVIGAAVIGLGARLLAERRRTEFAVLRARGASRWQVAMLALRASAAVTVPAAAAGGLAAVALTAGYADPLGWWLAALTAVTALAGPPLIAARSHRVARMPSDAEPDPPVTRLARRRRLAAEAGLLAAAVGGLVVLRQQGAGVYPSIAPVLVAVLAAVLAMRCYPLAVRALLRLARSRRGATALVAFARAAQASLSAALPAFALVLALTLVTFGAMVRAAVVRGEVAASWQRTGADAVIDGTASSRQLTPAVQRAISAVPGVRRTAAVIVTSGSVRGTAYTVAAVSPAQYAALIADVPGGAFPPGRLAGPPAEPVPALASPAAAAALGHGGIGLGIGSIKTTIQVAGTVPGVPGVPDAAVIVLPLRALGPSPPPPTLILAVGPDLDGRKLRALVRRDLPGGTVTLRAAVLASFTAASVPHSAFAAITAGSAAAAVLSVVVLAITLALDARSRSLTLARLRTMGLGTGQARSLVLAETLPQVVAAAVGGVACAWALAPLIGPSIDLSVFTGTAAVPVRPEPAVLAAALGGLVVLAVITLTGQAAIAGRRRFRGLESLG